LIALRNIFAGEQLTIEYNWAATSAIPCECGASNCRGWVVCPWELDQVGNEQVFDAELQEEVQETVSISQEFNFESDLEFDLATDLEGDLEAAELSAEEWSPTLVEDTPDTLFEDSVGNDSVVEDTPIESSLVEDSPTL